MITQKDFNINELEFKPLISFNNRGNNIQRCETKYKGVCIVWETFFPYNIFKDPTDTFLVDRIVPMDTEVKGGVINGAYYTEDGFGYPEFKTLESAIEYVDTIKN